MAKVFTEKELIPIIKELKKNKNNSDYQWQF